MPVPSIRDHHLRFAQVECGLTLITEACQSAHLLLMPTTAAGPAAIFDVKVRSSAYSKQQHKNSPEGRRINVTSLKQMHLQPVNIQSKLCGTQRTPLLDRHQASEDDTGLLHDCSAALLYVYRDLMSRILLQTPSCYSTCHSTSQDTTPKCLA